MKALIITYNRLELPVKMALWLNARNIEPIFIDNNSDYIPLLEYYADRCPYKVLRMDQNYGHMVVWSQNVLDKLEITGNYIVSDPDLDLSGIPDDFLNILEGGLIKYPKFDKCGFSLEINDVTNKSIIEFENNYWIHPLDSMYFNAPIDTTFALYKSKYYSFNAIRTNRPYTARHIPWYYNDFNNLPDDEVYYFKNTGESSTIQWRFKE